MSIEALPKPASKELKPSRFSIRKNGDGTLVPRHHNGLDPGLVGEKAFSHPAVREWWKWLLSSHVPRSEIALVTPCSNVKPYTRSPTSRKTRGVLRRLGLWGDNAPKGIEWYYFSDLLILVPYDRAEEYPACCYEVPPSIVLSSPTLKERVTTLLSDAMTRLSKWISDVIVFLPRRHLSLWEEARSKAAKWPRELRVKYTLFSFTGLEAAIKTVLEELTR